MSTHTMPSTSVQTPTTSAASTPHSEDVAPRVSGLAAPAPGAFLSGFDPAHAADVASWVRSDRELLWLAPATAPPITVEKVLNWGKERRRRQLYWDKAAAGPVGYAELNDMPEHADRFWIGHFIIDPRFRGRGLGVAFVRALLVRAFMEFVASEVSLVVFPDNLGAIRCYEEAGMVALGQERKHFEATSRDHVFLRMGIHRTRFTRLAAAGRFPAQPLPFVERPPDGGLLQPG